MNKNYPLIPHQWGRHGEVIIRPVSEIPKEAQLVEENHEVIVGHSESGHHHFMTLPRTQKDKIKLFVLDGKVYLDLPMQGNLVHQKEVEKHDTQVFEPGKYEVITRQAYSYGQKIMTRILD